MTQGALAEAAGIADQTLSRIERAAFEPAVSTLEALADALDVTLDALVGRGKAPASPAASRKRSPVLRRLVETAEALSPVEQRVLLQVARLLIAAKTRGKVPTRSR